MNINPREGAGFNPIKRQVKTENSKALGIFRGKAYLWARRWCWVLKRSRICRTAPPASQALLCCKTSPPCPQPSPVPSGVPQGLVWERPGLRLCKMKEPRLLICFFFFIVVKYTWHKIYHFNHFQFGSIKYIHNGLQPSPLPVSRIFSSSQTETLHPLNKSSSFSPLPAPGNLYSTFYPYKFEYSRHLI